MEVVVMSVTLCTCISSVLYVAYYVGYAKGRLFQIDKLVGSMSKQDAAKMLTALERLCDFTETVAKTALVEKAAHH